MIDAFMLLLKHFDADRQSGMNIMHKLLPPPEDPTREEFLMYYMAAKMSKIGKTPVDIFNAMDEDGGGNLDRTEFVEGMQTKLGIMFSEYECEEMVKYLDEDNSGTIEIDEFI